MEWITIRGKIHITSEDGSTMDAVIADKTKDTVSFSIPADDKNFRLFHMGERVEAIVFERNKGIGFKGVISGRMAAEAPTYIISQLSDWATVQRRDNVRVPLSEPLTYTANRYLIDSLAFQRDLTGVESSITRYLNDGYVTDLSAGGMKFSCDENIREGQKVILRFSIQDSSIILSGTVMHRQLIVSPGGIRYYYGVRFDEILEDMQEKIVNHVFRLMRKAQRK